MFDHMRMAAAEEWKLPRDVVTGEVLVSFVGRRSVTIENYRGILLYDESRIKLQANQCKVTLLGKGLHIDYYDHDEMKISGLITALEFGE